jgi:hypothetical protein
MKQIVRHLFLIFITLISSQALLAQNESSKKGSI